jgi:hypothetical protein
MRFCLPFNKLLSAMWMKQMAAYAGTSPDIRPLQSDRCTEPPLTDQPRPIEATPPASEPLQPSTVLSYGNNATDTKPHPNASIHMHQRLQHDCLPICNMY